MRCRRYVMTMTRQTRRAIGGIAVTVSPHRFPYGSLLLPFFFSLSFFFSSHAHRHRRSYRSIVIVAPGFYEAHCIPIGHPAVGGSRDIESDDSQAIAAHAILRRCQASRTSTATFTRGANTKMHFSRGVVRRIKETAMAVA